MECSVCSQLLTKADFARTRVAAPLLIIYQILNLEERHTFGTLSGTSGNVLSIKARCSLLVVIL